MEEKEKVEGTESNFSRRAFIGSVALAGAALAACGGGEQESASSVSTRPLITPGPDTAPDGPVLTAGLVGCGGRGTGAALNFLESGPNLQITALADLFQDRMDTCRQNLKERAGVEIPDERCFLGFDAYQQLIDSGVDIVLLATPPHFRPEHFEAAVNARKHIFMEKPVAVDPWGVRSIIASAERADAFELNVVTGTQFRHQKSFVETYNRVAEGAIGEVLAARAYSLRGQLWYREPQPEWSEMEAMLRDWVNWNWLSGDLIVEQHIHGLDVLFWFSGENPVKAIGQGARHRRVTGDQYDTFSIDYELPNGVHLTSLSRQMDGCTNNISRWVVGTRGYTNCEDTIFDHNGNVIWTYESENDKSPYVQEHTDLVTAIRTGNRVNEAVAMAHSTLSAIMGRESAYTGQEVLRDQLQQAEMRLGPTEYAMGPVGIEAVVPVPGTEGDV